MSVKLEYRMRKIKEYIRGFEDKIDWDLFLEWLGQLLGGNIEECVYISRTKAKRFLCNGKIVEHELSHHKKMEIEKIMEVEEIVVNAYLTEYVSSLPDKWYGAIVPIRSNEKIYGAIIIFSSDEFNIEDKIFLEYCSSVLVNKIMQEEYAELLEVNRSENQLILLERAKKILTDFELEAMKNLYEAYVKMRDSDPHRCEYDFGYTINVSELAENKNFSKSVYNTAMNKLQCMKLLNKEKDYKGTYIKFLNESVVEKLIS